MLRPKRSSPVTSLTRQTALITGASSGIGAATALKLAKAGVKVGIAARRPDRLKALKAEIDGQGGEALVLELDVADPDAVRSGVDRFMQMFDVIDILFNNAGVMPVAEIDQFKVDEWNTMIDINIKGMLNLTAIVLPHMIRQLPAISSTHPLSLDERFSGRVTRSIPPPNSPSALSAKDCGWRSGKSTTSV